MLAICAEKMNSTQNRSNTYLNDYEEKWNERINEFQNSKHELGYLSFLRVELEFGSHLLLDFLFVKLNLKKQIQTYIDLHVEFGRT